MIRIGAALVWASAALGLAACAPASTPVLPDVPEFQGESTSAAQPLPESASFLALDEEMREFVRKELAGLDNRVARLQRLSALTLGDAGLALKYDADLTLTAREAFHRRTGNCLSFTALVVALAREAGLEAYFQHVPVLPNWQLSGDTFVVEQHVNALVLIGTREFVLDFRPPRAASYQRVLRIDDANASAQYFGNLGAERFAQGDLAGAYRYFRHGLETDRTAASLWSNLGVVLGRNRQWLDAERAYRTALDLDPENLSALNNLAMLLREHGDAAEARRLFARLEDYRRRNPYHLYWQGERRLAAGQADEALGYFAEALKRIPAEADLHFAMARAYLSLGQRSQAERSYESALRLASSTGIRNRYIAEFQALAPTG